MYCKELAAFSPLWNSKLQFCLPESIFGGVAEVRNRRALSLLILPVRGIASDFYVLLLPLILLLLLGKRRVGNAATASSVSVSMLSSQYQP